MVLPPFLKLLWEPVESLIEGAFYDKVGRPIVNSALGHLTGHVGGGLTSAKADIAIDKANADRIRQFVGDMIITERFTILPARLKAGDVAERIILNAIWHLFVEWRMTPIETTTKEVTEKGKKKKKEKKETTKTEVKVTTVADVFKIREARMEIISFLYGLEMMDDAQWQQALDLFHNDTFIDEAKARIKRAWTIIKRMPEWLESQGIRTDKSYEKAYANTTPTPINWWVPIQFALILGCIALVVAFATMAVHNDWIPKPAELQQKGAK